MPKYFRTRQKAKAKLLLIQFKIQFGSIQTDLNWFVPIWSGLIQFYPIWSNFVQFGRIWSKLISFK